MLFLLAGSLLANPPLDEKIKSYIGTTKFETQKNLIKVLFASRSEFIKSDGNIDSVKVIEVLKKNGLIRLLYDQPVQLKLAFRTQHEPLIFLQIINETLELMGYSYFLTNNALRDSAGFVWEIYLQTEHILDPVTFANALKAKGCDITNIIRNNDHYWFYDVNSKQAHLEVKTLEYGISSHLGKPLRPYWVNIKDAKEIIVNAHAGDNWYPDIVFFDGNLGVLDAIKANEAVKNIKLKVPEGTVYVKMSDAVMLDNIKRGLTMSVK